ncbi:MAG: dTDP-4-dehydrorhamnose 3,5-epimerase family protein, partial [Acidimicrobiales bacterium]
MAEVRASEAIHGVVLVDPVVHGDQRGLFVETWRQEWLPDVPPMVQSNRADRTAGAVVGLHYHRHQADYWYVVAGSARVVLHDLRVGSPTLGATLELDLGGDGPQRHRG